MLKNRRCAEICWIRALNKIERKFGEIKNVALKVSEEFNAQLIYDTCNESAKYNSTISKTALPHG
ncbi:unnamed protein product [Brugia timori]|uniref:Transposase n=1 Tax=Brugia timori TaxID=42155 RepID=A0A0R3Q3V6_9BILA|nr:unnamed protein product [Brugia timori]